MSKKKRDEEINRLDECGESGNDAEDKPPGCSIGVAPPYAAQPAAASR